MTILNLSREQSQPKPNNEIRHSKLTPELAAELDKLPKYKPFVGYTVSQERSYKMGQV
jgi:hypothetical protein